MSVLAQQVEDYLRLRRAFGYELVEAARLLPRFVAYLEASGVEFVTIDAAIRWALEPNAPPGSVVSPMRMLVVRGFARYMAGIDPRTEIPPAGVIPFRQRWRPPFLYSEADIVALMAAARRLIAEPLRAATYETLIGLLAVSGLRIGEAVSLDRRDIDWSDGVLLVRRSKFGKSRHVPMRESTVEALGRYARQRDELAPKQDQESFFVSLRGTKLLRSSVEKTFRMLCDASGVGAGSTLPPRVHDLRHAFAVRTLLDWYRDGADVQPRLPSLSTYLGHLKPSSTYLYLSAAPELLAHAARLLDSTEETPR
jgi:integrase/recombinase XerD